MDEKAIIEDVVPLSEDQEAPVLLHFQNGELNVEVINTLVYKEAAKKNTNEKEAVVAVNGGVYHGPIKNSQSSDMMNNFIAVRSAKTGKVRLIQVRQASLVNSVFDKKETPLGNRLEKESTKALLIKNFGGRLANRSFERNERMKVNVDVVKSQLDKTADDVTVNEEAGDAQAFEDSIAAIRPPFNKSAKRLDDVYSLYDVVPKELLERLNQEVDAILACKVDDLPFTSEYVRQRIKSIKESGMPSSSQNINTIKALIYLEALGNVVKLRQRNMSRASLSNITEKVENDIRDRFSQPEMSTIVNTSYTKNKAVCYYIVLALLTSPDYEIDVNTLKQEMSLTKATLFKFAQYVNAKFNSKKDILRLELPEKMKPFTPSRGKRKPK